ncbi:MAG: 30S ribosomal protein S8 [Nitrosomonas sp.]|nr:30S ribosomal protein S8 [Nitrosomonas sp.]MCP5250636.1 30S ribosomal protein S8 [Burkholderiales bacterium]MCP5291150.1 30S ribosomal protein S8 [Burkholderiales bacterium]MDR4519755.1 30S ribosomal protein S8 [Nitrosomonas sp.]
MSLSDPIADMLTRIRNAQMAKKESVSMPFSKIKYSIASVLKDEGYIDSCQTFINQNVSVIQINLKYYSGSPVIESIKRVSRPGMRIYKSVSNLQEVLGGMGISIVSTSKGVMTGRKAKKMGIGGEVICEVV